MTGSDTTAELRFDPPGPGSWSLDAVHFPRPATRYWAEVHPEAAAHGTRDFARFYGVLFDALEMGYVNGFCYHAIAPVSEDQIPERFQRADEVFEKKLWREQLREWDETRKPDSIAAHRQIQAVDPDTLSDEELVNYITRCRDHHSAMISQHMRFTGAAVLPTGDFLAHVSGWTGLPSAQLLALTAGAASVSAGGSEELERLIATIGQDAAALELLSSDDDPGRVLATLRTLGGRPARPCRATSTWSATDPSTASTSPSRGRWSCPTRCSGRSGPPCPGGAARPPTVEEQTATVRSKVPEEHRAEFDELLAEARLTSGSATSAGSTATSGPPD